MMKKWNEFPSHFQRVLCVLLCLLILLQASVFAAGDTGFMDVPKNAWYAENIEKAVELGLFNGVDSNRFAPEAYLTRGMVATILWRYDGSPKTENLTPADFGFTDLAEEDWYYDGALWAVEQGIFTGFQVEDSYLFKATAPITREQMATVLCRYIDYKGFETQSYPSVTIKGRFVDEDLISDWALYGMSWCLDVHNGIMEGTGSGNYRYLKPQDEITRAEAATMMVRLVNCKHVPKDHVKLHVRADVYTVIRIENAEGEVLLDSEAGFVGDMELYRKSTTYGNINEVFLTVDPSDSFTCTLVGSESPALQALYVQMDDVFYGEGVNLPEGEAKMTEVTISNLLSEKEVEVIVK